MFVDDISGAFSQDVLALNAEDSPGGVDSFFPKAFVVYCPDVLRCECGTDTELFWAMCVIVTGAGSCSSSLVLTSWLRLSTLCCPSGLYVSSQMVMSLSLFLSCSAITTAAYPERLASRKEQLIVVDPSVYTVPVKNLGLFPYLQVGFLHTG